MTLNRESAGSAWSEDGRTFAAVDVRYAWYVVGALSLINMISYVERQLPTLLFGQIKKDFVLTDTQVSLLAGFSFMLFYVAFGLFIGRLADRSRRTRIIVVGILFWSAATMLCGFARNFLQLFLSRVSVGVGEATLAPSAISIISDLFPATALARALGVYTGAQYLGAGLALVAGGAALQIAEHLPRVLPVVGHIALWQMTFLLVGSTGLLVVIPMSFVREPVRRGLAPSVAASGAAVPFGEVWKFARANRRTLVSHYAAFSISSAMGFGTVAWVPTYFVRVHHWALHDIGYAYGLMVALLGGAGVIVGARFAEWLARLGFTDAYLRAPMISLAVTALPLVAAMLTPDARLAMALLAVATFLSSFPVSPIIAALQVIAPNQMRGQIVSFYLFVANILGVGLGPVIVALLTDYVFRNELDVGRSIALLTVMVTPIVVLILALGLGSYRKSVAAAAAWTFAPAKAAGAFTTTAFSDKAM
ncbi:MAG TPA: MFS transporter [Rhizomicrobium sp.]|nr:MFS transporter [Rhizomicrobium sp.]